MDKKGAYSGSTAGQFMTGAGGIWWEDGWGLVSGGMSWRSCSVVVHFLMVQLLVTLAELSLGSRGPGQGTQCSPQAGKSALSNMPPTCHSKFRQKPTCMQEE
jgi:hypothetical protein